MTERVEPAVVCVPARDEVERLPRLIRSLAAQDGFSTSDRLRVVIVANNCRDGTGDAVSAMIAGGDTKVLDLRLIEIEFAAEDAHVGTARRLALDSGADWLEADGLGGVLLTTDADAWAPPNWVAANLSGLRDADIVGGRLAITRERDQDPAITDLHTTIERYWEAVRAIEDRFDPPLHDPAPRHGDHTGASLALSVDLYRAVGGLPRLRRGEDNALVARAQEHGARLRHCPNVFVHVSDRAEGRAEGGMAVEMLRRRAVVDGKDTYLLPAPEHWFRHILRRAALRRSWPAAAAPAGWLALARTVGLSDEDRIVIDTETCENAIAFVERASRRLEARTAKPVLQPLDAALAGFDALLGLAAA